MKTVFVVGSVAKIEWYVTIVVLTLISDGVSRLS